MVNGKFYDVALRTETPYLNRNVFNAVSVFDLTYSNTAKFIFNEDYYFTNSNAALDSIQCDFSDGFGFRKIEWGDTVSIVYGDLDTNIISLRVYSGTTMFESTFAFKVADICPDPEEYPNDVVADITATIPYPAEAAYPDAFGIAKYTITYGYTDGDKHTTIKKPLLFLPGLDPGYLNYVTGPDDCKYGMNGWIDIAYEQIFDLERGISYPWTPEYDYALDFFENLWDQGYDVIYFDYKSGDDYMQRNAFALVEMINWINANKDQNIGEDITIIGASMGGQITRYALTYMENNNMMHCTRLFIAFDSGAKGSNLPLSLQEFGLFAYDVMPEDNPGFPAIQFQVDAVNRPASRQLLVPHYAGAGLNQVHSYRTTFLEELFSFDADGYPDNVKKIAVANGNKSAMQQIDIEPENVLIDLHFVVEDDPAVVDANAFFMPGFTDYIGGDEWGLIFEGKVTILDLYTDDERVAFVPADHQHSDTAPGSKRTRLQQQIEGSLELTEGSTIFVEDFFTFNHTISTLDINTDDLNFDIKTEIFAEGVSELYPFESYYAPEFDTENHVQFSGPTDDDEGNTIWMLDQIKRLENDLKNLPATFDIIIETNYNFGNVNKSKLYSVNINEDGVLQINGNYITGFGNETYDITPVAASNFTVYTSLCNETIININSGGIFELGDDNTPTNNKGNLELLSGSELSVNDGGTLKLNKYSKLYIKDGAILKINTGSIITVDDYAEIIVADGGKLILNAETLNLLANNSKLDIQGGGIVETAEEIDFTFTGNGFVSYNDGGIFDLGEGSKFRLNGTGITDHILSLNAGADLLIEDNDVELSNGKIYYYSTSSFTCVSNTISADHIDFNDISGYANHGLKCSETILVDLDYCLFNGFNTGLLLNDIEVTDVNCPAEVTIDHCDFADQRGNSIDAYTVSKIDGYVNTIIAKNSTVPYGIYAIDVTDFKWRGCTVKNYTTGTGIFLEDVHKFTMMAGTVKTNNKGIEAYHSNIYLQNKAVIQQNNYGIYMDGANYGVSNADELCFLVVGDQGCGWIINNTTAGVKGWDIFPQIDAYENQNQTPEDDLLINRFDGNGIAFNICVDDNNTSLTDDIEVAFEFDVPAKGNYWKSTGDPTEGTDYEINFKGGSGHNCDVEIPVDATLSLTTQPSGCNCTLPFPCEIEIDDPENIEARIAETSCDETIPIQANSQTQIMVGEQFRQAYMLFTEGDYNYAYQKFNYLKNQVEYNYPQGIEGSSCRRIYFTSLYLKELCAVVAEAYCQYPFWIEAREEYINNASFFIYPNPANTTITFSSLSGESAKYQIRTLSGELLRSGNMEGSTTINVETFAKSIYLVIFSDENSNIIETQKIILQ